MGFAVVFIRVQLNPSLCVKKLAFFYLAYNVYFMFIVNLSIVYSQSSVPVCWM